jgi:hypothetical protein
MKFESTVLSIAAAAAAAAGSFFLYSKFDDEFLDWEGIDDILFDVEAVTIGIDIKLEGKLLSNDIKGKENIQNNKLIYIVDIINIFNLTRKLIHYLS